MNETIKAMIEAMEQLGAGYLRLDLGKYSLIIADKETAEAIDKFINEE